MGRPVNVPATSSYLTQVPTAAPTWSHHTAHGIESHLGLEVERKRRKEYEQHATTNNSTGDCTPATVTAQITPAPLCNRAHRAPSLLPVAHRALQSPPTKIPAQVHQCARQRASHPHNVISHPPRTHGHNSLVRARGLFSLHALATAVVRRRSTLR